VPTLDRVRIASGARTPTYSHAVAYPSGAFAAHPSGRFFQPCQPTLVAIPPAGPGWLHEKSRAAGERLAVAGSARPVSLDQCGVAEDRRELVPVVADGDDAKAARARNGA
jgi:hypothetical protein